MPNNQRWMGLNVNAHPAVMNDAEWGEALDWIGLINPLSVTIMDNAARAIECQARYPDILVMPRSWNPFGARDDTRDFFEATPQQYCDRISNNRPDMPKHLLNEPTIDNVPFLVDWLIAAMDYSGKNGKRPQRMVVGNFAVDKSFQLDGTKRIKWESEWLRFAQAFQKHLDWHILGLHRYWLGNALFALVDGYPANLLPEHPQHQLAFNPANYHVKTQRLANGDLPHNWHGWSDTWFKRICLENGLALMVEATTEALIDEKRDPGTLPIIQEMDRRWPSARFNGGQIRGMYTTIEYNQAIFQKPFNDVVKMQLEALNSIHQEWERGFMQGKQLGAHIFSYTRAADWNKAGASVMPFGEYVAERRALLTMMTTISPFTEDVPTMPEHTPDFQARRIYSTSSSNVRTAMVANNNNIAFLLGQTPYNVMWDVNPVGTYAPGQDWYQFRYNDVMYYIVKTNRVIVEEIPDTDPPPEPLPDEQPFDPERRRKIRAAILAIIAALIALAGLFGWNLQFTGLDEDATPTIEVLP